MNFIRFFIWSALIFPLTRIEAEPQNIKIAFDVWCPFTCESPDKPGLIVEMARMLLEKNGYKVSYQVVNWSRAIADARKGEFDAIAGAAPTDAPDFFFPSKSLGVSQFCLYTLPDSKWEYSNIKSLEEVKLGWPQNYSAGAAIDSYVEKNKANKLRIEFVSGNNLLEKNLKKLQTKRITAIAEDRFVMDYFLNQSPIFKVRNAGCEPEQDNTIGFSPKNPANKKIAEVLGKGVDDFKSSPEYKSLLKKYGIK